MTNVGDKVYFRNDITANFDDSNYLQFNMSGSIAASGNVNSLYSATNFNNITTLVYEYCYYCLFMQCTSLTTAPALPATTLAESCYSSMFSYCDALISAPALSALTLTNGCYNYMFDSCESLIIAPKISATSLNNSCCECMFSFCSSLRYVPQLYATQLYSSCYETMFYNCRKLYISDTQTADAPYEWKVPASGTFTNTSIYNQSDMFGSCLGTRSSNTMSGAYGQSHTYYTQNPPVT